MDFQNDAAKSLQLFQKFSVHAMKKRFSGATTVPIEGRDDDLARMLDMIAGIDGLIVNDNGEMDFYSSRVQVGKNYETFTLRRSRLSGAKTEFAKLQQASRIGGAMPQYTIQTFVDYDEQSATVAIAPTVDLVQFCERHNPKIRTTVTGETFFVIPWTAIESAKIYRVIDSGNVEEISR